MKKRKKKKTPKMSQASKEPRTVTFLIDGKPIYRQEILC